MYRHMVQFYGLERKKKMDGVLGTQVMGEFCCERKLFAAWLCRALNDAAGGRAGSDIATE